MLISSSPLSSAAWQTAPIHNSSQVAQSVHSENGSAPTAQPANPPAAQSTEHTASDQAQQKDATGAEASHPSNRRASKNQNSQGTDHTVATGQTSVLAANTAQLVFQAVLNEVMPQPADQAAASQFGNQLAHPSGDGAIGQDLAGKAAVDALLNGKTPVQQSQATAVAPGFQMVKEHATRGVESTDLGQKLAGNELAFAARVVQRASVAATVALRDAQTVISASRFDAPKPGASIATDSQTALPVKKSDTVSTATAKTSSEQQAPPAGESQLSGDASSNQESGHDAPSSEAAATLHAAAEPEEGGSVAQLAQQNTNSFVTAAAPSLAAAAGSHGPATAKAADGAAPQLVEPPGEIAGARAGESVHNISLRLTNAEQGSVQVRLSERAGELHISVRTPDTGLTRGLRDGLPDLMGRLQVNGYRAETWQPGGNGSNAGQDRGQDAPAHGNSQQRHGGGSQQQNSQDQQQQDEQTPQWVRELESSIQRSQNPWSASSHR